MTWRRGTDTRDQPPLCPWLSKYPPFSPRWFMAWSLTGLATIPIAVVMGLGLDWLGGLALAL